MSNTAVGQVYKRIIDAVVEQSRTDFEENGVNNTVLQALQDKWQDRLSGSQRALFPWDPQPEEPAPLPEPTPTPSADTRPTPTPNPGQESNLASPSPVSNHATNGVTQIKQEPGQNDTGYANTTQATSHNNPGLNPQYASQRAQQLLQQQFGSQASGSIGAIQAADKTMSNSQQRPSSQHQNQANVKRETPSVKQEDSANDLVKSQTDGSSDAASRWDAIIAQRDANGGLDPLGRIEIDGFIRRQVEQMAERLEGGGLLLPLKDRYRPQHRRHQRNAPSLPSEEAAASRSMASLTLNSDSQSRDPHSLPQYDGTDGSSPFNEDGEGDDDAINSELDDSDDGLDNIEAGFDGDVILCLYDKVQRVKNKWKCTLKDGVVTVKGKDYVFHKAQGEFEW